MPLLIRMGVLGGAVALLPWFVSLLLRIEYPTFESGIVLVTGAVSGIGHDASFALAESGYTVFAGVLDAKEAEILRGESERRNVPLHPVVLDITKQDDVDTVATAIADRTEPLVAVVNNAGIGMHEPVETAVLDNVRKQFEVNVLGTWRVTQALLPLLRAQRGRVVIIGSIGGVVSSPLMAAYTGTKHALEAFSDALRMELLGQGVSVSLVQPGGVRTGFLEKEIAFAKAAKQELRGDHANLYGSLLQEQIDTRVEFLASKEGWVDTSTDATTTAITHAIWSRHPKTRYPVTGAPGIPSAVIIWLFAFIPDRLADFIVMNI